MRLVTYRKGSSRPRVGAQVGEAVLDLAALAADLARERGAAAPEHPVYFTKAPETVVAPGARVIHHAATKELDYEVELAVVIGAAAKDIPREQALAHVFGYTVVNDVTARDLQKRHG